MKEFVKMSCGHEQEIEVFGTAAERQHKISWYEQNGICDDCKNAEKSADCEEVEMLYRDYKRDYANCKTKSGSYDKKSKTLIVYVPYVPSEPAAEHHEVVVETARDDGGNTVGLIVVIDNGKTSVEGFENSNYQINFGQASGWHKVIFKDNKGKELFKTLTELYRQFGDIPVSVKSQNTMLKCLINSAPTSTK